MVARSKREVDVERLARLFDVVDANRVSAFAHRDEGRDEARRQPPVGPRTLATMLREHGEERLA